MHKSSRSGAPSNSVVVQIPVSSFFNVQTLADCLQESHHHRCLPPIFANSSSYLSELLHGLLQLATQHTSAGISCMDTTHRQIEEAKNQTMRCALCMERCEYIHIYACVCAYMHVSTCILIYLSMYVSMYERMSAYLSAWLSSLSGL